MTFFLYIRSDQTDGQFLRHSSHPTYKEAGLAGQSAAGNVGWYIQPKSAAYVPSREEQFLEDVKPRSSHQLTVELAMED